MTAHTGPPGERGGAPTPGSAHHHQRQSLAKEDQHPQNNRPGRQCRRRADLWREGYCHGFLAALCDVARASDDPNVWVLCDRVGENFTLPTDDGYGLAR